MRLQTPGGYRTLNTANIWPAVTGSYDNTSRLGLQLDQGLIPMASNCIHSILNRENINTMDGCCCKRFVIWPWWLNTKRYRRIVVESIPFVDPVSSLKLSYLTIINMFNMLTWLQVTHVPLLLLINHFIKIHPNFPQCKVTSWNFLFLSRKQPQTQRFLIDMDIKQRKAANHHIWDDGTRVFWQVLHGQLLQRWIGYQHHSHIIFELIE